MIATNPVSKTQRERLAYFNQRRTAEAAPTTCTRVAHALETLGADVPERLAAAGRLRLAHPQASLAELGQFADPALTKDALAGRLRRLLAMAEQHTGGRP